MVLSEVVDSAIELVRDREDRLLADLRARLQPQREQRRKLENKLAELRALEWQTHQLGQWVQITSEDGAFGRQPAPTASEPPAHFSADLLRSSLEVPWHRDRAWKGESEEPPRSGQEQSEDAAGAAEEATPAGGDPTGQVSELDESEGWGAA
jgi:hypothetical protein